MFILIDKSSFKKYNQFGDNMNVFMFDKEFAKKNNCYSNTDSNKFVVKRAFLIAFYFALALLLPMLIMFIFNYNLGLNIPLICVNVLSWVLWIWAFFYLVYGIYTLIKWLDVNEYCKQTAVIKENNQYWAVRLLFIPEITSSINTNAATSTLSAADNIGKASLNHALQKKLFRDRENAESYITALNDARKPDTLITPDIHKHFNKIYNGSESVIKLDNLKFMKETKNLEIYQYVNEKGKRVNISFVKAYPNLKETVTSNK